MHRAEATGLQVLNIICTSSDPHGVFVVQFLKQKEIESIGDALDIEGRMDLMDMGLARKSALVAGRISKV